MKLTDIKGVGEKKKEALASLDILNPSDLYTYLPYRYEDRSQRTKVINSINGIKSYYQLEIINSPSTYFYQKNKSVTRIKAKDDTSEINIIWYNDRFSAKKLVSGKEYKFFGLYQSDKNAIINPIVSEIEDDLIGGISPIYSFKKGISSKEIIKFKDYLIDKNFSINDYFTKELCEENNIYEINEMYRMLHKPDNHIELYKSIFELSLRNLFLDKLTNKIYMESLNKDYIKYSPYDLQEIINKLKFKLTKDQISSLEDIQNDMYSDKRMNRILIGDVGSGKTIIAILASIIAIKNDYQVSFMAPTEILAIQHYTNYKEFYESIGIKPEILLGSTKASDKKDIYKKLESNDINIIFGTHALFQEKVEFNNLGLIITDEQQRFGVYQRKMLAEKGKSPDTLLLSATPIPRTLALSFYNNLDISFIKSKPSNRLPIKSYIVSINQERKFIDFAVSKAKSGEQVYIIASRLEEDEYLESIEILYKKLRKYISTDLNIDVLHGQMSPEEKERKQNSFIRGDIDILIATSIVEVGIDNPNATVVIIYDSNQFGMSQLHQIRGRVGRSDLQSYCFFVLPENISMDEKINFLSKNNDGFEIAKKDLEIRGSGEIFGINQSGFIELDNNYLFNEKLVDKVNKMIDEIGTINPNLQIEIDKRLDELNKIILN